MNKVTVKIQNISKITIVKLLDVHDPCTQYLKTASAGILLNI